MAVHRAEWSAQLIQDEAELAPASAADEVCNRRPDKANRYSPQEQTVLLPAYERCHTDAVQRALSSRAITPTPLASALPRAP